VEDRMRGRTPPPREDRKGWYEAEGKAKEGKPRDRFACENCGNPSLQFFADGLGRCPGCGQRFRYSNRPTSLRSKQKHKQFICSQCDSKNLQFFLDGRGVCPHCRREFRWKK
jgi:ribosomal protein L37AE/L43A